MKHELSKEKIQWLHDACEEAAAVGIKLTMNPNELLMFTSALLAAHDQEPVYQVISPVGFVDTDKDNYESYLNLGLDCRVLYTHPAPSTPAAVPESTQGKLATLQLASIINDLSLPDNVPFVEITNEIFRLKQLESLGTAIAEDVINAAWEHHLNGVLCGSKNKQSAIDFLNDCRAAMLQSEPVKEAKPEIPCTWGMYINEACLCPDCQPNKVDG